MVWVGYVLDKTAPSPDDMLKLSCYVGPNINISQAMIANILKENGPMLHRSTYRPLTPDELADKDGSDAWEQFIARVYEKLGSWVLPRELEDIGLENTSQYDPYEDEIQKQTSPHLMEELELMPEVEDYYIGTEILLPKKGGGQDGRRPCSGM